MESVDALRRIPQLTVREHEPLALHTRFAIGGPARVHAETANEEAFAEAARVARDSGLPVTVIGGGTNLIVSAAGYPGIVLVYTGSGISAEGSRVRVEAGAILQDLVDFAIARSLKGLETLAGIPGWTGAAIYGNAGAYGHSISESVASVRFFDGERIRELSQAECEFQYRESRFKRNKEWIVFSAALNLTPDDGPALRRIADDILAVRNAKFPPTMKCAGSIFKNFHLRDLPEAARAQTPPSVVREGKVPAAYFLEQVGAKGMRIGGIEVADYHANLIYNRGRAAAHELVQVIEELKARCRDRFGIAIEEEVQYVGFAEAGGSLFDGLAATPRYLRELTAGLTDARAAVRPTPGKFSPAEIAGHLARTDADCYRPRLTAILNAPAPPAIAAYPDGEADARPLSESLLRFERERARNLAVLRSLAPSDLERQGIHAESGPFTLAEMIGEWTVHDVGHLRQLAAAVNLGY